MSLNAIIKQSLKAAACLAFLALSLPNTSFAADAKPAVDQLTYEPTLENQDNPNETCARCHKFDKVDPSQTMDQSGGQLHFGKFHGAHLTQKNPNNGEPINCVSCHGKISGEHTRGVKDVMRFEGNIFAEKKPMYSAQEQNQVCFACHEPNKLREKFWAHDVHAMKLPCASCHTLHPKDDAMKGIQPKNRVKLCVDCHGEQHRRQEAKMQMKQSDSVTEQKDKK